MVIPAIYIEALLIFKYFFMKAHSQLIRFYFLLAIALSSFSQAHSQSFPINEWVEQLDTEKIYGFKTINHIIDTIWRYDSITVANTFSKMEERGKSLGKHFHFRMQHLRIVMMEMPPLIRPLYGIKMRMAMAIATVLLLHNVPSQQVINWQLH
jgi:hypothetical protein